MSLFREGLTGTLSLGLAVLLGLTVGFSTCWTVCVQPLMIRAQQQEQALHGWQQVSLREREALVDLQSLSTAELQKWVASRDLQQAEFNRLTTNLHAQELMLQAPPLTQFCIAALAVLLGLAFTAAILSDGNAQAAQTLHNAVAVLPALRQALEEHHSDQPPPSQALLKSVENNKSATADRRRLTNDRMTGTIRTYRPNGSTGWIRPENGGRNIWFHRQSAGPCDDLHLKPGTPVSYRLSRDSHGRYCAVEMCLLKSPFP